MTDEEIAKALGGKVAPVADDLPHNDQAARDRLAELYRDKKAYPRRGWLRGECIDCKATVEGEKRWETAMWICPSCASKRRTKEALAKHLERPRTQPAGKWRRR